MRRRVVAQLAALETAATQVEETALAALQAYDMDPVRAIAHCDHEMRRNAEGTETRAFWREVGALIRSGWRGRAEVPADGAGGKNALR